MTTINQKIEAKVCFRDLSVGDWYLDEDETLCQKASNSSIDSNCYFITEEGINHSYEEESSMVTRVDVEINIILHQSK